MATLRPFRDYDEKDVINLYSFSGTIPANRGTLVKIVLGYQQTDEPIDMIGSPGATYNNTQSQRYGAHAKVAATNAGDAALGLLLKDVRETDENGELLKFNPVKAAEMDVVLSGQACPVVTKGVFLYSGANASALLSGTSAHTRIYAGASGELTTGASGTSVGYCLGGLDSNNCVMIRMNIV